jgi:hypothetical protein
MKTSDIQEIINEIKDRENEAVTVVTDISFDEDMLRYILEDYVAEELSDDERYEPLIKYIEERHDLGQEITGTDVLHWIKYG